MFRSGRTRHAHAQSSGSRKLEAQDKETLSAGGEPSGRYTVWGDLSYGFRLIDSMVKGIHASLRSRWASAS
jgi:hypothetical protein